MRILLSRLPAAFLAVMIAVSTAPALHAEDQKPEDTPAMDPADVTDGQVVSFVNAYIALEQMRLQFVERIEAAETQAEREQLIQEADEAGIQLVDQMTGISASEYVSIAKALPQSEELQARVAARIEELKQRRAPKTFSLPSQAEE